MILVLVGVFLLVVYGAILWRMATKLSLVMTAFGGGYAGGALANTLLPTDWMWVKPLAFVAGLILGGLLWYVIVGALRGLAQVAREGDHLLYYPLRTAEIAIVAGPTGLLAGIIAATFVWSRELVDRFEVLDFSTFDITDPMHAKGLTVFVLVTLIMGGISLYRYETTDGVTMDQAAS
ncbi:hypothetical protein CKO28_01300 [Rhodovibrio sodomensis]|uniref:Uncharacterized protein n=1 Tax=Rhodovibrio sodomensis TaxID=1088 RepID=A0ABS1DB86_9PROT|nr:hypothetical protein [Rhodovibrio sodomensis]MBK1666680.1 hypothetical protein [Rhodovibrio sodomensis]